MVAAKKSRRSAESTFSFLSFSAVQWWDGSIAVGTRNAAASCRKFFGAKFRQISEKIGQNLRFGQI